MFLDAFRIVSANVRGVTDKTKREAIFDYFRKNADILVLQETHSTVDCEKIWESEWGGKALYSHGSSASRGVAVFVIKKLAKYIQNIVIDNEGRVVIFDIVEDEKPTITVVALYAPNQDSPHFFHRIGELIRERSEHKIVIGDYNLVLDNEIDRLDTYCNNNNAKDVVNELIEEFCLVDVWRIQNKQKKEYSWFKSGRIQKASRIDFALVSGGLDQQISSCMYIPNIKSDHRALYLLVEISQATRGTGYWKMNTSLLVDKEFVEEMIEEIEKTKASTQNLSPRMQWEQLKTRIKKKTIDFSKRRVNENNLVIAELSEKLNEFQSRYPLNEEETTLCERTKEDFEDKMFERTKGLIFRSKVRWYEGGEKNTKYFFALEKTKYNAKTCYKLVTEEGTEVMETGEILELQRNFYQELYKEDQDVQFSWRNNTEVHVSPEAREIQDQQITMADLQEGIKKMKNNKTPGEDGIPVDFYKIFWRYIKEPFYAMMLEAYNQEELHASARRGILNLIPKAGKDTRYIKNLRPITLLNTDYKIIEKAIANKMTIALKDIIHADQRGFMKERRISVNIRKLLDIMYLAEVDDLPAVVLSLDFVKCFDKCSFSILHGSLEYFGFGEKVKQWTKILYQNFMVKVQNNGHFSDFIKLEKGVHQGGCCSSVYFLVIAEILAISLRGNEDIDGLILRQIRSLLNQFADDMDIFSLCNERSLRAIFEELDNFYYQSGFMVSYEKTTLYRIGSLRHSNATLYNLDQFIWSNKDINVLGVQIAHDNIVEKNYADIIEKVKKVLNSWENRGLTLIGKIQVVNTLVASLFVYKMMVMPSIPSSTVKTVDNLIRNFIWNGKKAKVAYNILQNQKVDGGLNLVNLKAKDKSLKVTWPQILDQEHEYAGLVYKIIKCSGLKSDIWRCQLMAEDVKKLGIKNSFWEDIVLAWCEYNYYLDSRFDNQLLWYNSRIRVRDKPFFWLDSYDRGLKYVYQLFHDQDFKSEQEVRDEYGLSTLRYNALKASIPKDIKQFFVQNEKSTFLPLAPHTYDFCILSPGQTSRKAYKSFSDDALAVHNKYLQWRVELGEHLQTDLISFAREHAYISKKTNVVKYRSFEYRLYQRALVTNIHLKKWGLSETEDCSFCHCRRESVSHLLFYCEHAKNMWLSFAAYVNRKYQIQIDVTDIEKVLFSNLVSKRSHVINFLCIIIKQYIYRQKCQQKALSFSEVKGVFNSIQNVEKYIAIVKGNLNVHLSKWLLQPVGVLLNNNNELNEYVIQYNDNRT